MDQTKYINAFVDVSVGELHEYIANVLRLKTQLKLTQEMLSEKDRTIENLLNRSKTLQEEINEKNIESSKRAELAAYELDEHEKLISAHTNLQHAYSALQSKLSNMDTCLNQLKVMKNEILERDAKIGELETKLQEKSSPKKSINRKTKITPKKDDDF